MSVVGGQPKKHANASYKATKHNEGIFLISDYYWFYFIFTSSKTEAGECLRKETVSCKGRRLSVSGPASVLRMRTVTYITRPMAVIDNLVLRVIVPLTSSLEERLVKSKNVHI